MSASTRARLAGHHPAFALEVRTPVLTLRYADDDDLVDLAEVGAGGVHDPEFMPFSTPWTRVPSPYQERNTLEFMWTQRCTIQGNAWHLTLVTVIDGAVAGTQAMLTTDWKGTRTVETGSWLGREFQGRGFGKEMRVAALHLAFEGFGVERAITSAYADNPASLGVTRALGYRPNGDRLTDREGEPTLLVDYVMERAEFDRIRRDDIELVGAAETLAVFGSARVPGAEPGS